MIVDYTSRQDTTCNGRVESSGVKVCAWNGSRYERDTPAVSLGVSGCPLRLFRRNDPFSVPARLALFHFVTRRDYNKSAVWRRMFHDSVSASRFDRFTVVVLRVE